MIDPPRVRAPSTWHKRAMEVHEDLVQKKLLRQSTVLESAQRVEATINGRDMVNFSSNDYLGWASDPQQIAWLQEGAERYGVGSGASHWVVGHSQAHEALESALCDWLGFESVALFSTGYMANLAAVSALAEPDVKVHQDRLNHASLLQAGQLASSSRRYPHLDLVTLSQRLDTRAQDGFRHLVVTDGVFSMDGNVAPIEGLVELTARHDTLLMVDDAHGLGVLGPQGRGSTYGLDVPLVMGTLGKAIGVSGAFVGGHAIWVDWIKQKAKPYTYTTAMSPALAHVATRAIQRLQTEPHHQETLQSNIRFFRSACEQADIGLMPSQSAIQPWVVGDNASALSFSQRLADQGYWVGAIRPPTVPQGTARLRIALSAGHTQSQISGLVEALKQCAAS
jgi:8-amino-7-oxononanoate synthase